MEKMDKKIINQRYKIDRKIGTGGMADVFEAYDTSLSRKVAIKMLHPQFAQEKDFIERFKREAQSAANLSHPNIVNVYDWGKENNSYFIVMEFIKGSDLKKIIKDKGPFSSIEAINIISKVCQALQTAHKNNIIHRDIKPHNIILTNEDEVKVTDFGIARAGPSSVTQTGSIVGTPQYISPEQAKGNKVNNTSDLYSVGVVLYEMLTGRVPFKAENPLSVAMKHVNEEPLPPTQINPNIFKSLEKVILKAMSKNQDDRYQTADELLEDLRKCKEGLPIKDTDSIMAKTTVMAPSKPIRSKEKKRKKNKYLPWIFLVIAILLSIAIGAFAFFTYYKPAQTVTVPNFKEMEIKKAQDLAEKKGLKLKIEKKEYHDEIAKNHIISQDPKSGLKVKEGDTVKVIVSKGSELVAVPDLTGKTTSEAGFILGKKDLEIGEISKEFSDKIPEDTIIGQDPPAGQKVKSGTKVDLIISQGIENVQIPDVIGKTSQEAAAILGQKSLKVTVTKENSSSINKDIVIRMSPQPGTEVKKGSTVNIVVSLGPEKVEVPNLIDKTEAEARSILESKGLKTKVQYEPTDISEEDGRVVRQFPSAEKNTGKGSTVTIYIGDYISE